MTTKITRLAFSAGLSLGLGLSFTPVGCGSPQEAFYDSPSRSSSHDAPEVPGPVAAQLERCANQGADRLTLSSYAILLDVTAAEDGQVLSAKVKDSMLGDPGIESCMRGVLRGMSLPASVMRMRSGRRGAGGVVAPESRALLGNPAAAAAAPLAAPAIVFNPVTLLIAAGVAAGVTILVVVTVYVVENVSEPSAPPAAPPVVTTAPVASAAPTTTAPPIATWAPITQVKTDEEKERCRKVTDECIDDCIYLTGQGYRPPRRGTKGRGHPGGGTNTQFDYNKCLDECLVKNGCK